MFQFLGIGIVAMIFSGAIADAAGFSVTGVRMIQAGAALGAVLLYSRMEQR